MLSLIETQAQLLVVDSNSHAEIEAGASTQWIEIEVLRLNATAKQITVVNNPFGALNVQPWARRRSTRAAPRGSLHEGRSTGVAPRGPLHGVRSTRAAPRGGRRSFLY